MKNQSEYVVLYSIDGSSIEFLTCITKTLRKSCFVSANQFRLAVVIALGCKAGLLT